MHRLSTIRISGDDALEFLQGQLSNDLHRLDNEAEILAAWCNPKGRVIWFGTVAKRHAGYALSVPSELADAIVKRLTMYRFRAKVEFDVVDEGVCADAARRIKDTLPWIGAEQSEQFTPHMLNLDLLDAISLEKGCYTGQEIVARTHYKGASKRRTLRFESERPVSVGDRISAGGRDIGEVLNAEGNDLLAVVRVESAKGPLEAAGSKLTYLEGSNRI